MDEFVATSNSIQTPIPIVDGREEAISKELDKITDFYLPIKNALDGFFYPKHCKVKDFPFVQEFAYELLESSKEKLKPDTDEFVVRYKNKSYRGHRIKTIDGDILALRRMPQVIPSLSSLGLDPALCKILINEGLNDGGLILICGETGQGKSTTCSAAIKERMIKFSSFCLTIEDPPEMPLHGEHGNGRCLQTEVHHGQFAEALKGAMRSYPAENGSMLYVGETRSSETASEVLRAAMNGALVFTTTHASDVPTGLRRILSFAKTEMGEEEALSILSATFRLGIHQRLETMGSFTNNQHRKRLRTSFLMSGNSKTPVANIIRKGEFEALGTSMHQQEAMIKNQGVEQLLRSFKY